MPFQRIFRGSMTPLEFVQHPPPPPPPLPPPPLPQPNQSSAAYVYERFLPFHIRKI